MARRNARPEFAVIGLGRFGRGVGLTLVRRGFTVLGIDHDRQIVQDMADELTQTVALDSTDEDALRALDITSFDTVIVAIGNASNPLIRQTTPGLETDHRGQIIVDATGRTSLERVYAGGDIVLGAATVILAMGEGRRAAAAINAMLAGLDGR